MSSLHRNLLIGIPCAAIMVAVAWWPVNYKEPITLGIDSYEYHGPLFGNHTQSQDIVVHEPLESLGALLVRLRPADTAITAEVTITDAATNALLQSHTIPGSAVTDDAFVDIQLDPPIQHDGKLRLTFSAPAATADTALGIRFHPDDVYTEGGRLFDNEPVAGDLALRLERRLPLWRVVANEAQQNVQTTTILLEAALVSLLAASFASRLGWSHLTPVRQHWVEITLLALLAAGACVSRFPALHQFGGVSGGDPYNYLFITDRISHFENPLSDKRLPGFPLLLLPAYLTGIDDIYWMRLINIVSAGGVVFVVGLLARRIGLPWSVQLFTTLALAWQKDFYWTSLRPEAYTVYALLLVLCLYLFFSLTTWRRQLFFGLALGYAAMTRQEGFVLAAVLGVAAVAHWLWVLWHERRTPTWHLPQPLTYRYAFAFVPALVVVLPFFINNAIAYGNPLYTPYFAGERLNIVDSWEAFIDAAGATWGILGSLWKPSWEQLERIPLTSPLFMTSTLLGALWWIYSHFRFPRQPWPESVLIVAVCVTAIAAAVAAYVQGLSIFASTFVPVAAALVLISPLALIGTAQWRGVLLVVVLVSQVGIATWFHPFPKHYQQDYPLVALALATLLIVSSGTMKDFRLRFTAGATYAAIAFTFAAVTLPLYMTGRYAATIDRYNHNVALDSVVYRAIQTARTLPGPYGIDQAHLPARLYLPENEYYYENLEQSSLAAESAWLQENNIKTLVTTNIHAAFTTLPPEWQRVSHFKAEGKDEQLLESFVYVRK